MTALWILGGILAAIGLAFVVFLTIYVTECIKESIEAENKKSPYLYPEDTKDEV